MANPLLRFKQWLIPERRSRTAGVAKDPQLTPEREDALVQLPSELVDALQVAVNELPVHADEKENVLTVVNEAIAQWQKQPHLANNSVVVLSHPISSVSRILAGDLSERQQQAETPLETKLLDWVERPTDVDSIEQQIKEKLVFSDADFSEKNVLKESSGTTLGITYGASNERPSGESTLRHVAVIPNLCWCFLRSAEGLSGIDYLQETLIGDRRQFWVIGSGQVGWEYLKSTLKLHAYCGDVVTLPSLTGEQLQQWLTPIIEQFNIRFSDAALHKRFQNPDSLLEMDLATSTPAEVLSELSQEVSATIRSSLRAIKNEVSDTTAANQEASPQQDYFERLADIADGASTVALQLFVKSLRYRKVTSETSEQGTLSQTPKPPHCQPERQSTQAEGSGKTTRNITGEASSAESPGRDVVAIIPKLPSLPDLSQSDFYLLYSLMLHGDLTIRSLSKSLGDAPQVVTSQVQVLQNADVIEQKNGVITINPIHYPKLRRELAKNNFII